MKNRLFLLILLMLPSLTSFSRAEAEFLYLNYDYILNKDGDIDLTVSKAIKCNTHMSFNKLYGETFIVYNPDYQKLKINESYTIQADGNKIITPPNAFNEVLPSFAADAPHYNNLREMVVTHTGLEIGATIFLEYTISSKSGFYPELDENILFREESPIKECSISITIPENKDLQFKTFNISQKPKISSENGFNKYSWSLRNILASSKDMMEFKEYLESPRIVFSTWATQADVAKYMANSMKITESQALDQFFDFSFKDMNDKTKKSLEFYPKIINSISGIKIPPQHTGYRYRTVEETVSSAYGTPGERAMVLLSAGRKFKMPVEMVAVYPSWYDTSVPSLSCIEGFVVNISDVAIAVSPTEISFTSETTYNPSKKYFRVLTQDFLPVETTTSASASLKNQGADFEAFVILNGSMNPMLYSLGYPSSTKKFLTYEADSFKITGIDYKHTKVKLFGKVKIKKKDDICSFVLPEVSKGISSLNLKLPSKYESTLKLPIAYDESYSYEINLPDTIQILNTDFVLQRDNKVGTVTISIKKENQKLIILRSIRLKNNIIPRTDYKHFTQLIKLWYNNNYKMVVYR